MNNAELLAIKKAIMLSDLTGKGLLGPEEAVKFISLMVDQSSILKQVRIEKMKNAQKNIDLFDISARQLRLHVEGVDPGFRASITPSRRQLNSKKVMLPIEVSEDTFEENIEKEGFEDTLMSNFALAYSNDLSDLAWNGDEADADDFVKINDGWLKTAKAAVGGAHVYDHSASTDHQANFSNMLKAMPDRWKYNKEILRFFVSMTTEEQYRETLSDRVTSLGDAFLDTERRARYLGILVEGQPYIPDDHYLLTNPKNLTFGIEYAIKIERDKDIFADVRQYAITTKNDFEFAIIDAAVIAYDATP